MKVVTQIIGLVVGVAALAHAQESVCRKYNCANDVADIQPQVGRRCGVYNSTSLTFWVQSCENEDLYCPIQLNSEREAKCVSEINNPLRRDLPPGDFCNNSNQCFNDGVCENGVCTGKGEKSDCQYHRECNVGLYCLNKVCSQIKRRGETCDLAMGHRCEFGSDCFQGTCTQYGTVVNKKAIAEENSEFLCYSFFASQGVKDTSRIFCTYPPSLVPENFDRPDPNNLDCEYKMYESDTGEFFHKNLTAKCGFNEDNAHYCPKFRGEFDFAGQAQEYRNMWNNTFNCHIETSHLFCKDVTERGFKQLMAHWLKDIWETSSEDSFALVANNPKCSRQIINRAYWEIVAATGSAYLNTGVRGLLAVVMLVFYFA